MDKGMIIRPLGPELFDCYLDFFDNRAFTDNSPFSPCYCHIWHIPDREQWERDWKDAEKSGMSFREFLRGQAMELLNNGTIRGYFAFDGDTAAGWVNANDKNNYVLSWIAGGNAERDPVFRVKSVVCFEIAPEYRGRGIASALLGRVCGDAAEQGYDCVEGYAEKHDKPFMFDYTGPMKLYENCGFTVHKSFDKHIIMRKYLK